jgi:hypothetical protein
MPLILSSGVASASAFGFIGTPASYTMTYLVIGGGASGSSGYFGTYFGSAGGGGIARTGTISLAKGTVYTATIGPGGSSVSGNGASGLAGTSSSLNSIIATGGNATPATNVGGSNADYSGGYTGGGQGYRYQSGGGGAGSAASGSGANGGNGILSSITGTSTYYAGGGQGQIYSDESATAGQGSNNYGGGGNGTLNGFSSGAGVSGVVILKVPTFAYSGTVTGSPTITTVGAYKIITFTSNGTYTS